MTTKARVELDRVTIRFAGDSGDGGDTTDTMIVVHIAAQASAATARVRRGTTLGGAFSMMIGQPTEDGASITPSLPEISLRASPLNSAPTSSGRITVRYNSR